MDEVEINEIEKKKVNPHIVELFEEMLVGAKSGQIISTAIAIVHDDGNTGNAYGGMYPGKLLSELLILQREIMDSDIDLRLHKAGDYY